MCKYLLLLFFLAVSAFSSNNKYSFQNSTLANNSTKEEKVIAKNFVGIKDSLVQHLNNLEQNSETRVCKFRDSLLSKFFQDADSILPVGDMNNMKENLKLINDKKSYLKLYIVNSTDKLQSDEKAILTGYTKAINKSSKENDVYDNASDLIDSVYEENTGIITDSVSSLLDEFSELANELKQKDSLVQLIYKLKLNSETQVFKFRDSLLSKSFKEADSILPADEINKTKENLKLIDDKKSYFKLYIVNSTDKLQSVENTILAGYIKTINNSSVDKDVYYDAADSVKSVYEEKTGTIADSVSSLLEAYGEFINELRQKELEKPGDIILGLTSSTHNNINLRDDGINQFVATPSIMFSLPLGFSAGYSIGYYSQASTKWDGSSLNLNYDLALGKQVSFDAAYSYFKYSSSAKVRKALFDNLASVDVAYDGEKVFLGSGFDFYIGKVVEPALYIDGGYTFLLTRESSPFGISFKPELLVCLGAQDPSITEKQLKKLAKQNNTTPAKLKKQKFEILGYQISLPFEFTYKRLTFELSPDYIIPVNVTDGSTSSPYFNLSLEVEYGLNIW
jgi:hypothetical protein